MSELKFTTRETIEELFGMETGYVIDFSNSSFQRFVKGIINLDVYEDDGYEEYCSKANKLRQVIENESNIKVAKLVIALMKHYEDFRMKNNELTDYDKKKIKEVLNDMEKLKESGDNEITIEEEVDALIQKISTRNAQFNEMAIDEKLKEIGNLIEYLLKRNNKFITLDYDDIFLGFINENDIKSLRKKFNALGTQHKKALRKENCLQIIKSNSWLNMGY
ncbi:hypothetical protein [Clostridium butyricum]|uniref:hypothetical protein n=1 Tax=Clostridium butyricum TaxID=1492 RepID=UPI002ABD7C3E|nr:hypothetical protein [Clostridium butyricum]